MSTKQFTIQISMVSMLASLSAATRVMLTFIPNVSLTTPITILAGVFLGPWGGFLVGLLSMVLSDIYIGFGPWTIVTSTCMGLVGVISGLLIRRIDDRVLTFVLVYLSTLIYDVLTSVLTFSVMLNGPVYVAIINLFTPVFIGFVPYPMGPVHEFSTALISTYVLPLLKRNGFLRVVFNG